jgi:hypothetical protein
MIPAISLVSRNLFFHHSNDSSDILVLIPLFFQYNATFSNDPVNFFSNHHHTSKTWSQFKSYITILENEVTVPSSAQPLSKIILSDE